MSCGLDPSLALHNVSPPAGKGSVQIQDGTAKATQDGGRHLTHHGLPLVTVSHPPCKGGIPLSRMGGSGCGQVSAQSVQARGSSLCVDRTKPDLLARAW